MPQLKFTMDEIRKVMEDYAESKFGASNQTESYFEAEINEDGQTETVEFIIECDENDQQKRSDQ